MLHSPLNIPLTLSQSKTSFLATNLSRSGKPYTSLVVAAAIFHPNATTHRVLLLKRSPAEQLFPYYWEIPGGKVDDTDKTIGGALKREVREETGLGIKESEITYGESGFEWKLGEDVKGDDAKGEDVKGEDVEGEDTKEGEAVKDDDVKDEHVKGEDVKDGNAKREDVKDDTKTEMALELNFMVESEETPKEVKLDPEEHLESLWAGESDIVGLKMTPEMRGVVEHCFAILKLRRRMRWATAIADGSVIPLTKH